MNIAGVCERLGFKEGKSGDFLEADFNVFGELSVEACLKLVNQFNLRRFQVENGTLKVSSRGIVVTRNN